MGIDARLLTAEPELKDLFELWRRNIFINFNCHAIGKVQVFDSEDQTATVTINYAKTILQPDLQGNYINKIINYPIIAQCPVIFLGGGLTSMTFPVLPGDDCFILFNDRDIDNWFQGASTGPVNTSRLHSFSDAICIVGLRNLNNSIQSFDTSRAALRYGTAVRTAVGADGAALEYDASGAKVKAGVLVDIETQAAGTLGTLLQNLLTQLQALTAALQTLTVTGVTPGTGVSGVPANAPAFAVIQAQLVIISTTLGTLLS